MSVPARSGYERVAAAGRDTTAHFEPPEILASQPAALLDKREVMRRVRRTYPTIWRWMQVGKFPRARDVHGRPGWLESEIESWVAALPVRRLKGDGAR
jgi:predicted DNA-binding transcriptional regulator AlpA